MERFVGPIGALVALTLTAVSGCKSDDCASGAHRDEQNEFCVAVPAGWQFAETTPDGDEVRARFVKGSKDSPSAVFEVTARAASEFENRKQFMAMQNKADFVQVTAQKDLPNGGWWFQSHNKTLDSETTMSFVKGKSKMAECHGGWSKGSPAPEITEACKSLRGLTK
ncbi:MAG: hypothetical protein U0263_13790 [Polyangiaceae bacterium]